MTMHILTENGEEFTGTPEQIVGEMARSERFQDAATMTATMQRVYMHATAHRVRLWCGEKNRHTVPDAFVEDLCTVGLWTRVHADADTCPGCEEA